MRAPRSDVAVEVSVESRSESEVVVSLIYYLELKVEVAERAADPVGKRDVMQLQLQATIAFHFTSLPSAHYSSHGRTLLWRRRRWLGSYSHWTLYATLLPTQEGEEAKLTRWIPDMLFQGEGEAFNVGAFLESISPYAWASVGIALCIGLSVVGAAWSVTSYERSTEADKQDMEGQQLRQTQGHLHNRHIDPRWWSESTTNPNEELDLHHFLRSRSNLRSHYEHCLLGEDGECFRAWDIQCWKLLHGICAVLVRTAGRSV